MRRVAAIVLLLLAAIAQAGDYPSLPSEPNWQTVRFPSGPNAVTVDVVEVGASGGTQLGNDRAASRLNVDGTPSDAWTLNLSAVPGYPVNCEPRTYLLRWNPDASDCALNPSLCVEVTTSVGGAVCKQDPRVQAIYTYTSTVVSAQGITTEVLLYYARRGERAIKWREIRHASDGDFATAESTEWDVYFYRRGPTWPELACTVRTSTNPATSLPSATACQ